MPWRDDAQRESFRDFIERAKADLCAAIKSHGPRFPTGEQLLTRYREVSERLLRTGVEAIDEFTAAHNELCLAVAILEDPIEPRCKQLDYEIALEACDNRFDFRALLPSGTPTWVEVKTIQPKAQNDWTKFKAHIEAGRFPENTHLGYSKEWLGGELYHNAFTARSRMLEYTLVTEAKVQNCLAEGRSGVTMLALFSNGFDWHLDELEDFVFFYRHGVHYDGDPFRLMEAHEIEHGSIRLERNIDHFAFVKRPVTELRPKSGTWSVKPPKWPPA